MNEGLSIWSKSLWSVYIKYIVSFNLIQDFNSWLLDSNVLRPLWFTSHLLFLLLSLALLQLKHWQRRHCSKEHVYVWTSLQWDFYRKWKSHWWIFCPNAPSYLEIVENFMPLQSSWAGHQTATWTWWDAWRPCYLGWQWSQQVLSRRWWLLMVTCNSFLYHRA